MSRSVYSMGFLLLLLCRSLQSIQLPTVSLPIDMNDKQLPHLFYVTQKISTAQNLLDIITTLNVIPASYQHNVLSGIQIKAIYQMALSRTIAINPNLLLHIYSIILLQKIPNTIEYEVMHIMDTGTNYISYNSSDMDYVSLYQLSEKALLWTLSSDVTLRHRADVSTIYRRMQNHMFNATQKGILSWTDELKRVHLELLIILYAEKPMLLLSSFETMIELNIFTFWMDYHNDSNSIQTQINLTQFQPIHLMWILRYIIHKAVHIPSLEHIAIYCTKAQRTFILEDALQDLIPDHGQNGWIVLFLNDIFPQLHRLSLYMDFEMTAPFAFQDALW